MALKQEEKLDDVIADLVDDDNSAEPATAFDGIDTESKAPVDGSPVQLTERATRQVEKIIAQEELENDLCLRVAVEGGGCSGLSYKLGLDYEEDDDLVIESRGVKIVVSSKHMMYLEGITIDYPDGLDARGFTFDNPNAAETCGCGSSFAT